MGLGVGTRLGPYEVVAAIGTGGMGEIYKAQDTRLDRAVAIKVLPETVAGDAERRARFEGEAKAVAALSHPNILAIHDFGTHDGISYAVRSSSRARRCAAGSSPAYCRRSGQSSSLCKSRRAPPPRTERGSFIGI